jgi:hypothetical protein
MNHSIECEEKFKEWEDKYPNRCQICNGAGGWSYPGTYWEPPDYVECEACIGQSKCPLCGEGIPEIFWDDVRLSDPLPCGHNWSNNPPECWCDEVCPNCRHEMKYNRTEYVETSDNEGFLFTYEVDIFKCPFCDTEVKW